MEDETKVNEYLEHFNKEISKGICDYTENVALLSSRYIFTSRIGKEQRGYCTHCHESFFTPNLKHNQEHVCPSCRSICTVKSSGMHRKNLRDRAYFVYFEKSVKDPRVIVAKGLYVFRDYSGDYRNVRTVYTLEALYVFKPGNPIMLKYGWWVGKWYMRSSVFSLFNAQFLANWDIKKLCSTESIRNAVSGTPFQYSQYEAYVGRFEEIDMVKYFALYSKYPTVEYIMKLGFKNLIESKLEGYNTYSAINWRGNTLLKVLRLNKKELKEIKFLKIDVSPIFLRLLQISKKDGSNLPLRKIESLASTYDAHFGELMEVLKYSALGKAHSYLNKQKDICKPNLRYEWDALITWKDYLADCVKLGWDMSDESVVYPKNVHDAHQNTIRQVKIKADGELNKKIKRRLKDLNKKYYFEYEGLMIRPAVSSIELLDEGKALNHCVGTYADRYAAGETAILLIRKLSDPGKPYYTMEVKNNMVYQVRGLRNCPANGEVQSLVDAFKAEKLEKKKNQNKVRVSIPA